MDSKKGSQPYQYWSEKIKHQTYQFPDILKEVATTIIKNIPVTKKSAKPVDAA